MKRLTPYEYCVAYNTGLSVSGFASALVLLGFITVDNPDGSFARIALLILAVIAFSVLILYSSASATTRKNSRHIQLRKNIVSSRPLRRGPDRMAVAEPDGDRVKVQIIQRKGRFAAPVQLDCRYFHAVEEAEACHAWIDNHVNPPALEAQHTDDAIALARAIQR